MIRKRLISKLVGVGLAGTLAVGCIGTRTEDFITSSLTSRAAVAAEAARVVRVIDADTYIMLSGSSTYRLRLLGVDAPEHDQAFGPQATESVARRLTPGRVVLVAKSGLDLYGRTLGAVLLPTATVAAAGRPGPLDSLLVVRGWGLGLRPEPHGSGAGAAAGGRAASGPGAVEMWGSRGGAAQAVALLQFRK